MSEVTRENLRRVIEEECRASGKSFEHNALVLLDSILYYMARLHVKLIDLSLLDDPKQYELIRMLGGLGYDLSPTKASDGTKFN
jgi:hypothetical protein